MNIEITFEQKVIYAVENMMDGSPLKDFMNDSEIEQAIQKLAKIYLALGHKPYE